MALFYGINRNKKEAISKALNKIIAGKAETCLPQAGTGIIDLQL